MVVKHKYEEDEVHEGGAEDAEADDAEADDDDNDDADDQDDADEAEEDDDDDDDLQDGGADDDESFFGGRGQARSSSDGSVNTVEQLSKDPLFLVLSQFLMSGDKNIVDALLDISKTLKLIAKKIST